MRDANNAGRPHAIFTMLQIHRESWRSIVRGVIPSITILLVCFTQMRMFGQDVKSMGYTVYFGETLFIALYGGINMVTVPLMVLLMVSELPKRFSFQYMALVRSRRRTWLASQILYCLTVSIAMFFIMMICVALTSLGFVSAGGGWSDFARIEAGEISAWSGIVNPYMRENFTPLVANLLATPPVILYMLTLLNIVLLCNLFNRPMVGVVLYLIILWAGVIFNAVYVPWLPIPRNYASLSHIDIATQGMGYYWRVLLGYVILNAGLYGAMLLRMRKTDLTFLAKPSE